MEGETFSPFNGGEVELPSLPLGQNRDSIQGDLELHGSTVGGYTAMGVVFRGIETTGREECRGWFQKVFLPRASMPRK